MDYIDEKNIRSFEKVNTSSWENMSDNVFIRLINKKYIDKYDSDIASKDFFDLAICISLQERKNNVLKSHLFTQKDLKSYKIDFNTALKQAMQNTENERGKRILSVDKYMCMHNTVYPLITRHKTKVMVSVDGDNDNPIGQVGNNDNGETVLMLCNKKDTFAASYMASFNILDEVFKRFNETNFYIVPVSTICAMCVKSSFATNDNKKPIKEAEEDLLDMLEQINDEKKEWRNILSYKIYYYYGDDNKHLISIK